MLFNTRSNNIDDKFNKSYCFYRVRFNNISRNKTNGYSVTYHLCWEGLVNVVHLSSSWKRMISNLK